jgi:hypothetical protein
LEAKAKYVAAIAVTLVASSNFADSDLFSLRYMPVIATRIILTKMNSPEREYNPTSQFAIMNM